MAKKEKQQQNDPTLPTLADGYFWRVGPKEGLDWGWGGDSYRGYGISLRQGRKRLLSSRVLTAVTDDALIKAAGDLYQRHQAIERETANRGRLAGDYPPKTL